MSGSVPFHGRPTSSARARKQVLPGPSGSWVLPRDGYRLALWTMVLLSLSRIHLHFGFVAALRPALLTALLALMFALMKPSALSPVNMKARPAQYMVALVIMACIFVPFGISIGNSGKFLLDEYFRLVLAYVLITLAVRGPREMSQFVWVFVISCGILSWMATSVFQLTGNAGSQRLGNLYTYDANDIGVLLIMGIPMALLVFETSRRLGERMTALYGRMIC